MPFPPDPENPDDSSSEAGGDGHGSDRNNDHSPGQNPPKQIDRYQIERQLGRGGFGFVYLASDPELQRQVAIKVPRWDRPLTRNGIDRFLNEGKLLAQVDCPSIVSVHDLGMDGNIPYVVMQYIEGVTLDEKIKSRRFSIERILELLLEIANALCESHKETIVHRDFKPSNVILDSRGKVHLVDFGMALHDDLTINDFNVRSPIGTPQYMSPEQIRGENHRIDGRTDVWAFGVTMYLLMTGRHPFRGEDRKSLTRSICFKNPRPIRQLNDKVSTELERICLRCLSKLMDERYQSMADLIDELKAESGRLSAPQQIDSGYSSGANLSQSGQSGSAANSGWSRDSFKTSGDSFTLSNGETFQIVPKGLRCFDENDHEFFLQLLPGPVDRLGLPDSVRFWAHRLGIESQTERIPIGIIFGPSGCGKSSFVRAGLIPNLEDDVTPVYIDCTVDNFEQSALASLDRELGDLPSTESLAACLRGLRVGAESNTQKEKVILVLDQFEQWLESCEDYSRSSVTEALRQCDPDSVQCLILIRDDFWMGISGFMRCLDQKVEEGRNAMSLPLFDQRHARNVLKAYGRSVQSLPPATTPLNRKQKKFVKAAIESISVNGSVLCMHVTILADMLSGSDWGETSFDRALGSESIGTAFLERYLTESTKVVKSGWLPACEHVLAEVLPAPSQQQLKAKAISRSHLYEVCLDAGVGKEQFEECMRYLASEIKLISEVDQSSIAADKDETYFQLTHDFFVTPCWQWLNRRRSETLSGRAQVRFDELSSQYEINNNKRYLPGVGEYVLFNTLVRKKQAKPEQKQFLKDAHRHHLARFAGLMVVGLALWFVGLNIWKGQTSARYKESLYQGNAAHALIEIEEMLAHPNIHVDWLRQYSESDDIQIRARSLAALTILKNDVASFERLLQNIHIANDDELRLINRACEFVDNRAAINAIERVEASVRDDNDVSTYISTCRLAAIQIALDESSILDSFVGHVHSPDLLTEFTDVVSAQMTGFPFWKLCDFVDNKNSGELSYDDKICGYFQILSALSHIHCADQVKTRILNSCNHALAQNITSGTFLNVLHCGRAWKLAEQLSTSFNSRFPENVAKVGDFEITFARIPKGSFESSTDFDNKTNSPSLVKRDVPEFFVMPYELTTRHFKEFLNSKKSSNKRTREILSAQPWFEEKGQLDTPMRQITIVDAIEFLNWLSEENERPHAYTKTDKNAVGYERVKDSPGFRFTSKIEHEYLALGGGSGLAYSWGTPEYVSYLKTNNKKKMERIGHRYQTFNRVFLDESNSTSTEYVRPFRSSIPTRHGIHELLGGISEMHDDIEFEMPFSFSLGAMNMNIDSGKIGSYGPGTKLRLNRFGFRITVSEIDGK